MLRAALAALLLYDAIVAIKLLLEGSQPPFRDFFGLWSFGRFAAADALHVYDASPMWAFQHAIDPAFSGWYPYTYPPHALLLFVPLGLLPIAVAYAAFMVGTFAAYLAATLGKAWRSIAGLAMLAAPTTLVCVVAGQNGFLSAALLVGGLRYAEKRPVLAGILFALLTYKPQFGLLVPVVLIAAGLWRVVLATIVATILLVIASSLAFGWSMWTIWLTVIPGYWQTLHGYAPAIDRIIVSMVAPMHLVGAPALAGALAQGIVAVAVLIVVWRLSRHGLTERAISAALIGTMLVTPYALCYDLPMVTSALVLEALCRQRNGIPTTIYEFAALILGTSILLAMGSGYTVPFAAPLFLLLVFWRVASSVAEDPHGSSRLA